MLWVWISDSVSILLGAGKMQIAGGGRCVDRTQILDWKPGCAGGLEAGIRSFELEASALYAES